VGVEVRALTGGGDCVNCDLSGVELTLSAPAVSSVCSGGYWALLCELTALRTVLWWLLSLALWADCTQGCALVDSEHCSVSWLQSIQYVLKTWSSAVCRSQCIVSPRITGQLCANIVLKSLLYSANNMFKHKSLQLEGYYKPLNNSIVFWSCF